MAALAVSGVRSFSLSHSPSFCQVCKDHAPCGAVLALVCPVLRSYLTKLRDDEFGGRRQIRVPATDDARLAPKAQRLVINGDHSVRFPVRKDLRGRKAEAVGHPECREDQRK